MAHFDDLSPDANCPGVKRTKSGMVRRPAPSADDWEAVRIVAEQLAALTARVSDRTGDADMREICSGALALVELCEDRRPTG